MKERTRTSIALAFLVALLAGCGAVDLTKDHTGPPPTCELHKCPMHTERIRVAGEIAYLPEYWETSREQFPHHGGHRYDRETKDTPFERDVIDFVCPECDKAYSAYWKEWKAKRNMKHETCP